MRDGLLLERGAPALFGDLPKVERFIVDAGIQLIKFWLEVGDEEQKRRFEARIDDPVRQWKLSTMDLPSRSKWYAYSRARDQMLEATDTEDAPWHIVRSDDKRRARLNLIAHFLSLIPYEEGTARKGRAAEAIRERRLRRRCLDCEPAVRPGKVLKERSCGWSASRKWLHGTLPPFWLAQDDCVGQNRGSRRMRFFEISTFATLEPRRLRVAPAPPASFRTLRPSGIATRCPRLESRGRNARYIR